jgi:phenylacetate-CoA ligase
MPDGALNICNDRIMEASSGGCVPSGPAAAYMERCREALDTGLLKTPAYRSWRKFDSPFSMPFKRLAGLPVMDKAVMRRFGPRGLAPGGSGLDAALSSGAAGLVRTSGSTGDAVENVWCQEWWDASESASWRLNSHFSGMRHGVEREALLASPLCVGLRSEDKPLSAKQRSLGRFLFLNERVDPADWEPAQMRRMTGELNSFEPAVLDANPSYLARLCRFIMKEGMEVKSPRMITLTYENCSLLHIKQISSVFKCPAASSYGSTETGYVFMQCEHGNYHQNTEFCHVDFIPFAQRHGGPRLGSLLVTVFDHPWRSLLRFDIGDTAMLAEKPCPCGRQEGLTLSSIEGRAVNVTVTADGGRAVTQAALDRAISAAPGLEDYQLLQTSADSYLLRYSGGAEQDALFQILRGVYGRNARLRFERAETLSPDPPGKYRLSKPLFPLSVKEFWDPALTPPLNPDSDKL